MIIKFSLHVKLSEVIRNQKYLTLMFRKVARKKGILGIQLPGIITSQNFAGLSTLTSNIDPEISRSIYFYFTKQFFK